MNRELARVETTLAQLTAVAEQIGDPAVSLATSMLSNAIGEARAVLNSATVSNIAFAANDVAAALESLSAADAAQIEPVVDAMKSDIEALTASTALPPAIIDATRAFQAKLRTRRSAIERQTYREGTSSELPHSPEELHTDAATIRPLLAAAGFSTPALDLFCDDRTTLRFHNIVEMIDELDVIVG